MSYRYTCFHYVFLVLIFIYFLALQPCGNVSASIIMDPKPLMRWEEMLACELVVLARYEKHEGKSLSLRVLKVLKGKEVKKGDVITVTLEHWYSIETGAIGFDTWRKNEKADGIPKLCYKKQLENPGPAVPVKIIPDVREPTIYFFPKEASPTLTVRGQVQPEVSLKGWLQALNTQAMDLTFRLAQQINPTLARDALEELYQTRDAETLQQLFDWVLNDPPPHYSSPRDILISIGDRKGDVYDPLLKLLKEEAKGNSPYRFSTMGFILAQIDGEKALRDLSQMTQNGSSSLKEIAGWSLGYIGDEKALNLAFDLLTDPHWASPAVSVVRTLFGNTLFNLSPHKLGHLREIAKPKLMAVLTSPHLAESYKKELQKCFHDILGELPSIDLVQAEKILLDSKTHQGEVVWEGHQLLGAITRVSDPKFIPLLVKILRDIPEARGYSSFRNALCHYATICPNTMKQELTKQGFNKGFDNTVLNADDVDACFFAPMGIPRSIYQLRELMMHRGAQAWIKKRQASVELIVELKRSLEYHISHSLDLPYDYLHILFQIDPNEAKPLLDQALARRHEYQAFTKSELLALEMKYGPKRLIEELLTTVHVAMEEERKRGSIPSSPEFLLLANDEKCYNEYLKILDSVKSLQRHGFDNSEYLDYAYTRLLNQLFPSHPADYFARVLQLLESESLPLRQGGEAALQESLHWNFDFASGAFASVRAEVLAQLKPVLKRLSAMSEIQMRAYVLRALGVQLADRTAQAWIPTLKEAALSFDPAVSQNALMLIEDITGEYGCYDLHYPSPTEREQALSAYLHDRGIK